MFRPEPTPRGRPEAALHQKDGAGEDADPMPLSLTATQASRLQQITAARQRLKPEIGERSAPTRIGSSSLLSDTSSVTGSSITAKGAKPPVEPSSSRASSSSSERARSLTGLCRGFKQKAQVEGMDTEIMRGVPLSKVLGRGAWMLQTSPIDMTPANCERLWECSEVSDGFDIFISQSWCMPGWLKYIGLVMHFYWGTALAIGCGVLAVMCALDLLGLLPTVPVDLPNFREIDQLLWSPCLMPSACLATLVMLFVLSACLGRSKQVFLDASCINQTNPELKAAGINSIAGFLAKSESMLVLCGTVYFSRLWCMYELAVFSAIHDGGHIIFCPVFFKAMVLAGFCICMLISVGSGNIRVLSQDGIMFIPGACLMIPCFCLLMHALRRYMREQNELLRLIDDFRILSAECRMQTDYDFIIGSIKHLYGSTENFDQYVSYKLKELLRNAPSFVGIEYTTLAPICFPSLCSVLQLIIGMARKGIPWASSLPLSLELLSQSLFVYPTLLKLLMIVCDYCSAERRSSLVNIFIDIVLGTIGSAITVYCASVGYLFADNHYLWGYLYFVITGLVAWYTFIYMNPPEAITSPKKAFLKVVHGKAWKERKRKPSTEGMSASEQDASPLGAPGGAAALAGLPRLPEGRIVYSV